MRKSEHGFTLVELLVTTVILGVIVYPLTAAVILALKTTNTTASSVSGAVAIQTLGSFYYGDVNSATDVSQASTGCMAGDPAVFLSLSWPEGTIPKGASTPPFAAESITAVVYALDPTGSSGFTLVRTECTKSGPAAMRTLGHFDYDPQRQVSCQQPTSPSNPALVTAPCNSATTAVTLILDSKPNSNATTLFAQRRST